MAADPRPGSARGLGSSQDTGPGVVPQLPRRPQALRLVSRAAVRCACLRSTSTVGRAWLAVWSRRPGRPAVPVRPIAGVCGVCISIPEPLGTAYGSGRCEGRDVAPGSSAFARGLKVAALRQGALEELRRTKARVKRLERELRDEAVQP